MDSEAAKYLKKYLFIEENEFTEEIGIPFHKVVQLMETYNARNERKILDKSQVMLPTDKNIEDYATQNTIDRVVNNDKGIGEVYMLKIGVELGAKWMRDLIKKARK